MNGEGLFENVHLFNLPTQRTCYFPRETLDLRYILYGECEIFEVNLILQGRYQPELQ